jgi:hypothetical protein
MLPVAAMALAAACPDCPPVRDARAMFFANDLVLHLAFALAPFAATLGVVAWIVRSIGGRARKGVGDARAR